jgi:hypothetical protein
VSRQTSNRHFFDAAVLAAEMVWSGYFVLAELQPIVEQFIAIYAVVMIISEFFVFFQPRRLRKVFLAVLMGA